VGLKEVAALAETSVATVSRVLSGGGYASDEVRARVLDAAQALDYQPNLRARGLRKQSSYTIGLIIPNLLNAYYTALADAVGLLLAEAKYSLLLASSRDDPDVERGIVLDMVRHDVAGLIWVPAGPDQALLDTLLAHSIPAVSIVRRIPGDPVDTVVFEDYRGSYAAAQHLLRLGHRRIGYIGCDKHSSNRDRLRGFNDAVLVSDVGAGGGIVRLGTPCSSWGEAATADLLQLASPVTAVYAASNALMPGVMKTLRQAGVRVPGELSVICFDDVDWFTFSVPAITAISISYVQLAEVAVDLLLSRVRDAEAGQTAAAFQEIGFELVERESTGEPPSQPPAPRRYSEREGSLAGARVT
jgi:LacI family transcriptional regulator